MIRAFAAIFGWKGQGAMNLKLRGKRIFQQAINGAMLFILLGLPTFRIVWAGRAG